MPEYKTIERLAGRPERCIVVDAVVKFVDVRVESDTLRGDRSRMEIELQKNDSPVRRLCCEPAIPLEKGDSVRLYFSATTTAYETSAATGRSWPVDKSRGKNDLDKEGETPSLVEKLVGGEVSAQYTFIDRY